MKKLLIHLIAALLGSGLTGVATTVSAADEQFIPILVYRTGPYAPNGIPWANGFSDYLNLIDMRDGGINGVKLTWEECETEYKTDRGVECYERLKGKGPTGASVFNPLSTGITYALTDKTTTVAIADSALKRAKPLCDCSASTMPVKKAVIAVTVSMAPRPHSAMH